MTEHVYVVPNTTSFMKVFFIVLIFVSRIFPTNGQSINKYVQDLKSKGEDPIQFTLKALNRYDLIIFDDAIHSAKEPFDFYQQLVQNETFQRKVKYVFVELFSIKDQHAIDQFLTSPKLDSTLLFSVFQDNFNGYGNRYQTYYDLLKTIRKSNEKLSANEKIRVIGVDQPIFWAGIQTAYDYDIFNKSLAGRDYFMYKQILEHLDNFEGGEKGIFLTNTRHAYKNLQADDGTPFWNCATFFYRWHKGKSCSLRIHNVNLFVERIQENAQKKTIEGTEQVVYRWVKMDQGKWDSAFALNGNKPVGFFMDRTTFGRTPYIGNQMLSALKGQKMSTAYDGLIFLAPLSELTFSAEFDFICTTGFKIELKRRILLMHETGLDQFLSDNGVSSIEELIEVVCTKRGPQRNTLSE